MATSRYMGSVTVLDNGSVLLAGGWNPSANFLVSAEVYNPATGLFQPTGSLNSSRNKQTAVKLPDGQVLVAGGYNGSSTRHNSTEIYNPSIGNWINVASMVDRRYRFASVVLENGTVLAVAGGGYGSSSLQSSEIYNPAADTCTSTGTLSWPRRDNQAIKLPNGTVMSLGNNLAATELYDPDLETWSLAGNMNKTRDGFAATLLSDGRVLATGGYNGSEYLFSAEIFMFRPALLLTGIEIVGPNEVAENSQLQYQAIAHYENNSMADVTNSANCLWSVEPNDVASMTTGLLTTEMIDFPTDITIAARYSEGDVNESAEKQVSVLTICPSGSALEFDGVDDYVSLSDYAVETTEFTVTAWANHYGSGGGDETTNVIFSQRDDVIANNKSYIILATELTDNLPYAIADIRSSSGTRQRLTSAKKNYNEWHHYAMTVNSTDFILYIDGEEVARTTNNQGGDYVTSIDYVYIAKHRWNGVDRGFFNGKIDDVCIYDRALSAEEIQAEMYAKPTGDEPNLVGYWNFDEGEGQVAYDSSINGNNAQLGSRAINDRSDPIWVISDAPVGICYPPVAVATIEPNQVVEGELVILDGSGSFDADEDILTFSWRFISKLSGSIAEIADVNSEQTTFIPDVPGEYTVGLVVSDDYFDSEEDEVNITVISFVDAIEETLDEVAADINDLDPNTVKNSNMTNALTNKIDGVLAMIDVGSMPMH